MSDIVLTAGVRSNLLQLQKTAELITNTQTKLATGKRVNNALDNPINFFTAQGLTNRASDLATQFAAVLGQVTQLARDAGFNGINLLDSTASANLTVTLNESGSSSVTVN